ncbi:MAG: tail protein X [Proteobacteria bacterium]|nr:tail protein X [Pseudomonadota bacterium]
MNLTHITTAGDRWDLLAWRYYRNVSRIPLLIDANPHIAIGEVLSSGQTVIVPIVEEEVSTEELPPWKR